MATLAWYLFSGFQQMDRVRLVASAPRGGRRIQGVARVPTSATGGGRYTLDTYLRQHATHPFISVATLVPVRCSRFAIAHVFL